MNPKGFKYIDGVKYATSQKHWFKTRLRPAKVIVTRFIVLHVNGWMEVLPGYAWNGPSGPIVDTLDMMYPSCGHDALFDLMLSGRLPHDEATQDLCNASMGDWEDETGVNNFRQWYVETGLDLFGGSHADPKNKRKTLTAPAPG